MLQCWAVCHLLLLSMHHLSGWAWLPAGLQHAILAVLGTGCSTRGQCCIGQPGTALTQDTRSLQVFALGCAVVKCSPAVTGVSAPEWAAACLSWSVRQRAQQMGQHAVPASTKTHLCSWWTIGTLLWHQTPQEIQTALFPCSSVASKALHPPHLLCPAAGHFRVPPTPCAPLQLDWYAEVAVCPCPGPCIHWVPSAVQLDSNQGVRLLCPDTCSHMKPCMLQLDSHAEVSELLCPGRCGHLMPCVLQLDSDAEVSDSLGIGTEGASQSHTAPYSQTPADGLGAVRGQDDRDYHPVLGDNVTSRGERKRAYGTRSKGRRSVRHCSRAVAVAGAVTRVSNCLLLKLRCCTLSVHAH